MGFKLNLSKENEAFENEWIAKHRKYITKDEAVALTAKGVDVRAMFKPQEHSVTIVGKFNPDGGIVDWLGRQTIPEDAIAGYWVCDQTLFEYIDSKKKESAKSKTNKKKKAA